MKFDSITIREVHAPYESSVAYCAFVRDGVFSFYTFFKKGESNFGEAPISMLIKSSPELARVARWHGFNFLEDPALHAWKCMKNLKGREWEALVHVRFGVLESDFLCWSYINVLQATEEEVFLWLKNRYSKLVEQFMKDTEGYRNESR